MNKIQIPIRSVHVETVFERSERTTYALLEPAGDVTPLRVKFADFRGRLGGRFSPELPDDEVARRLSQPSDLELGVVIHLDRKDHGMWEVQVRLREQVARGSRTEARLEDARRSPRRVPDRRTDIKVELGPSTLEGTIYNVSEHGLGVALFTTQLEHLRSFRVDDTVEVIAPGTEERVQGKIRSQYPADGGCVLGIELRDRFQVKSEA